MTNGSAQDASTGWTAEYYKQERLRRSNRGWRSLLQPSVIGAFLAIAGRIIVGPFVMLLLFTTTNYLSDATVLIKSDNSFFSFTEHDLSMAGGCTDCMGPCEIVLLKYVAFHGDALTSAPAFTAFAGQAATGTVYDFSPLSAAAIALGKSLDAGDAICQSGRNEWGSTTNCVTATAQQLMDVITTMNLSVPPQQMRELELGIEQADKCVTTWSMMGTARLFFFPTTLGSADFGKIPAVVLNISPDYTECRPNVPVDDSLVGSKLALATGGKDVLAVVPEVLTLFPYSFTSSIPPLSRVVAAGDTKYEASTVLEPLLQAYYGGCRVRAVNTTGIYIENTCEVSAHWEIYGLMVQSPDDVPLCSTSDVCIHNYFNTQWEWVSEITTEKPNRVAMFLNTFRSRYADTVSISVLPGVVVMQMLFMGLVSLYQVMSHKRSVLLTQIWAYRCQNGRMQVVYLAQITYHLVYNSDLYLLGFATGTLTTESLGNLTCCFFAFSYSFINLAKARSGDQQLDRHFRLVWETMQIVITAAVIAVLRSVQHTPLIAVIENNAQILRKTSALGAKYCGLNDACVLFTVNLPTVITIVSVALGIVALATSFVAKKMSPKVKSVVMSARMSISGSTRNITASSHGKSTVIKKYENHGSLTSFEQNCLGVPFKKLFHDCDDVAYVIYNDKRCTTVEALLLTGYLYYGEHIYQASSVMLLLVARLIPRKVLRTFNVILLRWRVDPKTGTLTHVLSCTWYTASKENHKLTGATPVC